ncbi:MAG: hypothetical protein ACFCUU_11575 [Cyclobacteriaceae bacterium]
MELPWDKILLKHRPWYVRLLMLTATIAFIFFIVNTFFSLQLISNPLHEMIVLAYAFGTFAGYVMVYAFDWS